MSSAIRCPNCGHHLATLDLPAPALAAPPQVASSDAPILLRVAEAARLLSVSRSTMYQLVARGELQVVRIGSSVRIPRSKLEQLASS